MNWHRLLSFGLGLSLALPPALMPTSARAAAIENLPQMRVDFSLLQQSAALRNSGAIFRERVLPKLAAGAKGVGYVEEIAQFQALLIMSAVAAHQVANEQAEIARLNGGALPETTANSNEACSKDNSDSSIFCSGDFYLGLLGGAISFASNYYVQKIFKGLLKSEKGRLGLAGILTSVLANAAMIFGASSTAFLWTEAVKLLPSAEWINQSRGIAGRAGLALKRGQWSTFISSQDGQIFRAILSTMYKILLVDDQMRDQWLYNTWRFGLNGEALTALAGLVPAAIASSAAAAAVGAGGAALAASGIAGASVVGGMVTLSAPAVAVIVSTAVGFGVMTLLIDMSAPELLTGAIRGARSAVNSGAMNRNRGTLKVLAANFRIDRNVDSYANLLASYENDVLTNLKSQRENWMNVAFENFYELATNKRKMEEKIAMAERAVKNQAVRNSAYVNVNGEIQSFAEAAKKLCTGWTLRQTCQPDLVYQLKALDKLKVRVASADAAMQDLADEMIAQYGADTQMIESIAHDPNLLFPTEFINPLAAFYKQSNALQKNLRYVFACTTPELSQHLQLSPDPGSAVQCADWARAELGVYYTQSYYESEVYAAMLKAEGNN
jgi:hypothetical protein